MSNREPLERLRHHVTGAIERGEAVAIVEVPANPWTVERVKDELPDVQVLVDGKSYRMIVRGRKLPFAQVRPFEVGSAVQYEFAWSTIADCLNRGVPLRA